MTRGACLLLSTWSCASTDTSTPGGLMRSPADTPSTKTTTSTSHTTKWWRPSGWSDLTFSLHPNSTIISSDKTGWRNIMWIRTQYYVQENLVCRQMVININPSEHCTLIHPTFSRPKLPILYKPSLTQDFPLSLSLSATHL